MVKCVNFCDVCLVLKGVTLNTCFIFVHLEGVLEFELVSGCLVSLCKDVSLDRYLDLGKLCFGK